MTEPKRPDPMHDAMQRLRAVAAEKGKPVPEVLQEAIDALTADRREPTLGIDWTGEKVPAETAAEVWRFCEREGKNWEDGIRRIVAYGWKFVEMPSPLVTPKSEEVPLHPDGQPYCKCDGPVDYGSHHRNCHRYLPEAAGEAR